MCRRPDPGLHQHPNTHFTHSRTCLHTPLPISCKVTVPAADWRWSSTLSSVCCASFVRRLVVTGPGAEPFQNFPLWPWAPSYTLSKETPVSATARQRLLNSPTWRWLNHDEESRNYILEFGQAGNVTGPHHIWNSPLEVSHVLLNPSWFTQT